MGTTLVLTRKPNALFQFVLKVKGKTVTLHGRFGTLIVLKGGKVKSVQISQGNGSSDSAAISVPTGVLDVTAKSGESIHEVQRYTTIERMDGYVQLHPHADKAYGITYEHGNSAVAHLRADGKCFRVHGGQTAQERGILIHEAPHVGWLIGCIGPRQLNDRKPITHTSGPAMDEMFRVVGHARAELFVLDW